MSSFNYNNYLSFFVLLLSHFLYSFYGTLSNAMLEIASILCVLNFFLMFFPSLIFSTVFLSFFFRYAFQMYEYCSFPELFISPNEFIF